MPDLTIRVVDKSLEELLRTTEDFPAAAIELSVGYVSASGVLLLRPIFKSAQSIRAVVGLAPLNRLSAFQRLRDFGAEVYVYVADTNTIFHPKIYFGTANAKAWAMVGSANLTQNGLLANIERNLFITGQRHTEPFISLETQIAAFREQAYPFDAAMEQTLREIERSLGTNPPEGEYKRRLIAHGIKPKKKAGYAIPQEAQQVALDTLMEFARNTRLEYAYQMLLLLVLLRYSDEHGLFSVRETADRFSAFYRLRQEAGLPREKRYAGPRRAIVDNADVSRSEIENMLKVSPFPRFERQGLLDISEDSQSFIVNAALLATLSPANKQALRVLAIKRLAAHFGEDEAGIEGLVVRAIG
ncbi:MAG: phospholipase D family protein [Chloroflexota bacterium]|nr:phospholipase D family protein [Chloroflexota bacterium]